MRYFRGQTGFFLIEALFAALILLIALPSLTILTTQAFQRAQHAHRAVLAANLAREKLEELKAGIEAGKQLNFVELPWQLPEERLSEPGGQAVYIRNGQVTVAGTVGRYSLVQVSVQVTWQEHSQSQEVVLETFCVLTQVSADSENGRPVVV